MAGATRGNLSLSSPRGVTVWGLVGNVLLGAAKIATGVVFHNQTILVDGLHTASDALTDVAVLAGLQVSGAPADEKHRYGHHRATTITTAVLALLLLGTGAYVGYRAVTDLRELLVRAVPAVATGTLLPLAMALLSIVVKEAMYRLTDRVGLQCGDMSLRANAWHHRSDAFSSVAAAAGIGGMIAGGPRWHFLDHLTALVLACFLGLIAWRLLRESVEELMDHAPAPNVLWQIEQAVAGTRGVRSFHAFRARRLAGKVDMDIHIQVDPTLTVAQGHAIASDVRRRIFQAAPDVVSVLVHVEPVEASEEAND